MKNKRWKRLGAVMMAFWVFLLPIYAQNDAKDAEFSFERVSEMEKRLEEVPEASKTVSVEQNTTNGVSETDAEAISGQKEGFPAVSGRSMNMWRSLGALLIVLGGLVVANKWLQGRISGRNGLGKGFVERRMAVLERLALDHRRQLVLVSVGRRELVLAVGPNEVRPVGQWDAEAVEEDFVAEVES